MRKMMTGAMLMAVLGAGALFTAGCEKDSTAQSSTASEAASGAGAASADVVPASLFATAPPKDAKGVVAAKAAAKAGDVVVLRGRIGGQVEPLAANRAMMTVADVSLPTCDNPGMESCKTPWDSCCEPADEIAAKSATVQVVGPDGRPLKVGLNGAHGLKPGREVVVEGKVRTAADKTLVVDASQVYVTP